MAFSPKHSLIERNLYSYVGSVKNHGIFVVSGSLTDVFGGTSGSATIGFDAQALALRRAQVWHSGSAATFSVSIENKTPNTGSAFDPRNIAICYNDIPGSDDFSAGIDQIEDLFLLTDHTSGSEGNIYLNVGPSLATGVNAFKYLMFFEATFVYVRRDGKFQ